MSGHQYTSNASNLFEEDDIDDETFLRGSHHYQAHNANTNPFLNQQESLQDRRKEIENRTIESSFRSVNLLRDTEQIGISTAEELSRQREQLENTSKQLDDINQTLRFSQKHINGLKSVFGGLKNYLSGQKDMGPRLSAAPSESKLSEQSTSSMNEQQQQQQKQYQLSDDYEYSSSSSRGRGGGGASSRSNFNQQLDQNLDEMAGSLSRLKGLAIDLNQDIDLQNDLIDSIGNKVEDVDIKIKRQNKDMNHLLGKK